MEKTDFLIPPQDLSPVQISSLCTDRRQRKTPRILSKASCGFLEVRGPQELPCVPTVWGTPARPLTRDSLVRSWLNWPPCWPCLPQPWPQGCPLHPTLPPTLSPRHGACLWLLAVSPHRIKDVLPLWGTRGWGTTAWQHSRGGHPRRPRTPAPSS